MKKVLLATLLMGTTMAMAQTYVGTMTVGDYTRKEVRVDLNKNNLLMHDVKFARMMPVKLDITIANLQRSAQKISGNNIVPTAKGKEYEKYTVRNLHGTATDTLRFECQMGKKQLRYTGVRRQQR